MAHGQQLASEGAQVDYELIYVRQNQVSSRQLKTFGCPAHLRPRPLEEIAAKENLSQYDVLLLALDGLRTRRFMTRFVNLWRDTDQRRPITVAMYPGVVFRFHLEGMMSRMSCDLFLLNSKADHALYLQLLASLRLPDDNAMVSGLPFLPKPLPSQETDPSREEASPQKRTVLFIGQPTVPAGEMERLYVVQKLVSLAQRFRDTTFVLKPRHRPNETTLHRVKYHYQDLAQTHSDRWPLPANLTIEYGPMQELLARADLCVTFSSTAALESITAKIPTGILSDLGINENLGNHFFIGSGLFMELDDIPEPPTLEVETEWLDAHVSPGSARLGVVSDTIRLLVERQRVQRTPIAIPNGRLFGRAAGFTEFTADEFGWSALEQFGDSQKRGRGGATARARRLLAPIGQTIANRTLSLRRRLADQLARHSTRGRE